MPHRRSLGLIWRRIPQRYRLRGTKCETCGAHFFPPRPFCPKCRRKGKVVAHKMHGPGKVYSYTNVHVPLEGFELGAPYVIAIVQLEEGPKVTAQLCDISPDEVEIGMPVRFCFRKLSEDGEDGIIHYAYKFERNDGPKRDIR